MMPPGGMTPGLELIDIFIGIVILCFVLYVIRELVHALRCHG